MSNYGEEKRAAEAEDRLNGFAIEAVEASIRDRLARAGGPENVKSQTWNHLSPQVFQTPYAELERIITEADPDRTARTWTDLGSAYGRLGIVLARLRPGSRFFGLELVPERVEEARRIYRTLGLDVSGLTCADLANASLPDADVFFIYDFGTREEIAAVLERLRDRARTTPIRVVGRGRAIRDAVERDHPWLASVHAPVHAPHYSIYRSA